VSGPDEVVRFKEKSHQNSLWCTAISASDKCPNVYRDTEDAGILNRIRTIAGTDSKAILSRLIKLTSVRIELTLGGPEHSYA
jgi:hypothetical protein